MHEMNRAIFIDKDGTLVKNVPYNIDPALIELEDDAAEALRMLKERGYLIIIVSNQSGVAHGYFEESELEKVKNQIEHLLQKQNAAIDAFYYCPHHPEGKESEYSISCDCRKPQPGMLIQAARDFAVDLTLSWMIGDILNDVEAGSRAGCKTILIDNGNETEWITNEMRLPAYIVRNLKEASTVILQTEKDVGIQHKIPQHH
jgi:D-glycero-D-manno-heptose 1,7-bisphosphate phosphatase